MRCPLCERGCAQAINAARNACWGAVKQTTVRNLSTEPRLACWRFMIETVELCPATDRTLLGVEAIAFHDADCIGFAVSMVVFTDLPKVA